MGAARVRLLRGGHVLPEIERKTYEDVAFRYLAGGQHPQFSTICTFRRTHLAAVEDLFRQVVASHGRRAS